MVERVNILFLGQCIAAGFDVMEPNAYPNLTKSLLETRFPALRINVDFKPLLHPTGLKALLKSAVSLKPDVVFISLPAIFAGTTFRLNSLYLERFSN
jgi:hypothetical protein